MVTAIKRKRGRPPKPADPHYPRRKKSQELDWQIEDTTITTIKEQPISNEPIGIKEGSPENPPDEDVDSYVHQGCGGALYLKEPNCPTCSAKLDWSKVS